uniref:Rieske domain-containing protein n=1 Tax=Pygocentrus nattereri TaxID=42514 RepID=A0AAR2LQU1_PYGNA
MLDFFSSSAVFICFDLFSGVKSFILCIVCAGKMSMGPTQCDEVTEVVCLESDLQDGQMKEVEVNHHKIVLVRNEGKFSAVGGLCTHYGAPLIKGALVGNRVRCPWHGACFNTTTGDIEEYPGLDSLPTYKVCLKSLTLWKLRKLTQCRIILGCISSCPMFMCLWCSTGPASLQCAETLRQNNYGGRIIIVTKDEQLPLDKTKLSKAMNIEVEKILLRPSDFLQQHGIEVLKEKEVVSVNTEAKTVAFNDGTSQHYDQLLISTGARSVPFIVSCPGAEMENVKLLESYKDAAGIYQMSLGKKAVIIGTSFIGMEVAAYLSDKAASVAVVGKSKFPYQFSLGPDIGKMTMKMLEEKNVKFYMSSDVAEMRGVKGRVKEIVLQNGDVLPADVVIVGIGVIPNSHFLKGSAVEVDSRNAVVVDKFMKTNIPDVFAAGDVASFPLCIREDKRVQIGHWQLAQAHGRVAALNMLNKQTELNSVPFFWTVLLGKSIRYTGYGEGYTDIVFKGNVDERKFLAFYMKGDDVVAAASLNFDPAVAKVAEIMATGKKITKSQADVQNFWITI